MLRRPYYVPVALVNCAGSLFCCNLRTPTQDWLRTVKVSEGALQDVMSPT
jgi:hypothetical protein